MAMNGMIAECPWIVQHNGHVAWYQRALMIGDLAPGRTAAPWHVVYHDGRVAAPYESPVCPTCNAVPMTDELQVIEIATGSRMFLAPYRALQVAWPVPKEQKNCWWCNLPAPEGYPPLCEGCENHLRRY